ncbi:uncharacterized protein LOC143602615 [Bidens hawaiensis]|uniref:uncharacterized protein LOC143602615 n=1 Tax=Bidens hawaiensis TaxID=980011 RepID=UPI0040499C9D
MYSLHDTLRQLTKGNSSVTKYSRKFKVICDQLAAIGQPVLEMDKFHWFLCGLGPSFKNFFVSIRITRPAPVFRDLVTQAEIHEIFMSTIHGSNSSPVAFAAQHSRGHSFSSRSRFGGYRGSNRGGYSNDRGGYSDPGGSNNRNRSYEKRSPPCQLCKSYGHFANTCPDLHKFAKNNSSSDES